MSPQPNKMLFLHCKLKKPLNRAAFSFLRIATESPRRARGTLSGVRTNTSDKWKLRVRYLPRSQTVLPLARLHKRAGNGPEIPGLRAGLAIPEVEEQTSKVSFLTQRYSRFPENFRRRPVRSPLPPDGTQVISATDELLSKCLSAAQRNCASDCGQQLPRHC